MQRPQGSLQDRGAAVLLGAACGGVGGACGSPDANSMAVCFGPILGAAAWGTVAGERGGASSGVSR